METNGDAEKAFEKWDKFIQNHPEPGSRREFRAVECRQRGGQRREAAPDAELRPAGYLVDEPERLREAGLKAERGALTKKVVWFGADPARIARGHAADLNIAYSIQGLDIASCAPCGQAARDLRERRTSEVAWRDKVRTKLKEMVSKEAQGRQAKWPSAQSLRKGATASPGLFDPPAARRCGAHRQRRRLSRPNPGGDLNDLCKTGGSVSSRRSSLPDPSSLKKAAASVPTKKAGVRMKASDLLAEQTKAPGTPGRVKATDLMAELAGKLKIKGGTPKVGVAAGSPTAAASGGNALMAEPVRSKAPARARLLTPPPYTLALFGSCCERK